MQETIPVTSHAVMTVLLLNTAIRSDIESHSQAPSKALTKESTEKDCSQWVQTTVAVPETPHRSLLSKGEASVKYKISFFICTCTCTTNHVAAGTWYSVQHTIGYCILLTGIESITLTAKQYLCTYHTKSPRYHCLDLQSLDPTILFTWPNLCFPGLKHAPDICYARINHNHHHTQPLLAFINNNNRISPLALQPVVKMKWLV